MHQRYDGQPLILDDPIVFALLDTEQQSWISARATGIDSPAGRGLRAHVVTRSRVAEDRLAAAVARGVDQYVILGAGYDTFAYRQPAWAARVRIFEVDQPATQADKRARLARAGIPEPSNLTFAPVDFEREAAPTVLARLGFDATRPSVFAWLGVTMYLDAAANDAVFRWVASLPRSSELVFTFAQAGDPDPSSTASPLAELAARVGEPWVSRYDPDALVAHLHEIGFSSVTLPSPAELAAAYFVGRTVELPLPRRRSIVVATV